MAKGDLGQQVKSRAMNIKDLHSLFLESSGVTTDTREIKKGAIFFALKGDNFDGNDYAQKAVELGASWSVCDRRGVEGARIIYVKDSLKALQDLAAYHRRYIGVPLFALTGTNGKTTTKELISSVLSKRYKVLSTAGNLNNHIGVPLTLLKMDRETEIAVIEMGASAPGEIELLCKIATPDAGLITNVGKAHLLGFGSFDGVRRTKGELYDYLKASSGTALYNSGNPILVDMINERKGLKIIPYGAELAGTLILPSSPENPFLSMKIEGGRVIKTNMIGSYNSDNVLAALAAGALFEVDKEEAVNAIEEYYPSNNRSQLTKGERNTLIIDAYNANPTSMRAALENFKDMECEKKGLVLGDMLELGEFSDQEHQDILKLALSINTDIIFLVGTEFGKALLKIAQGNPYVELFENSEALRERLEKREMTGITFLVKGSRGTRLERAIPALL